MAPIFCVIHRFHAARGIDLARRTPPTTQPVTSPPHPRETPPLVKTNVQPLVNTTREQPVAITSVESIFLSVASRFVLRRPRCLSLARFPAPPLPPHLPPARLVSQQFKQKLIRPNER